MRASLLMNIAGLMLFSAICQGADMATPNPAHIQRCNACHYVDGKPKDATIPRIAGQHELYLRKALLAFLDGRREGKEMETATSEHGLDLKGEEELLLLAKYYAGLKPADTPPIAPANPALVARGQKIFVAERIHGVACVDCHGPDGKGYVRKTPRTRAARAIPSLAGQQPEYLKKMLAKYAGNGSSKAQPGMCGMRKAGKTLSKDDVDALVEFLSSKS